MYVACECVGIFRPDGEQGTGLKDLLERRGGWRRRLSAAASELGASAG